MTNVRSIPFWRALLPVTAALITVGCAGASADATSPAAGVTAADTSSDTAADTAGPAIAAADSSDLDFGAVGSLASDTIHTIEVSFDEDEYAEMVEIYTSTGEKEWIVATVTLDGTTYRDVGLRLKGNSSLRGVSADDDPATLPWLIRLDKFVDDQTHDGVADFVVRSNNSETSLNEAVALELLELAGLASQDAVAATFSVNGGDPTLRLVIDHPDDTWMTEQLDASGALYKAESTGDYSYRGDDPDAYDEVFDQEAGDDNADLAPLMGFLDFINNSDDATFAGELGDRLDVDAFATYLAMQDLIGNFDDIDGPGNNSYLYYDTEDEQFTVVAWDHNLAFGQTPGGQGGQGGPGGVQGGPGEFAGGDRPNRGPGVDADGEFPAPPDLDADGEFPAPPDLGADGEQPAGRGAGGGFGGQSNVLVERFLAVDAFAELVETRTAELSDALIDSGVADEVLERWAAVVSSSGLVDAATVQDEADQIAATFD